MLKGMFRLLVVLAVVFGVSLSPVALDACLMSCQAPTSTTASSTHHACHSDGTTGKQNVGANAKPCGHDHGLAVDGVAGADHLSGARLLSTMAAVPSNPATGNHSPLKWASSPPRPKIALTSPAASALSLRV
jgi:hypothetical protein